MLPGTDHNPTLSLRLEVAAPDGLSNMAKSTCVLTQQGGSLGRAEENDIVLPDHEGIVSRVHATIEFAEGEYLLVDKSTNGTYLGGAKAPLERDRAYPLKDGDLIQIGSFSIVASLVDDAVPSGDALPDSTERLIDMDQPVTAPDPFAAAEDALDPLSELDGWSSEARRPAWFPAGEDDPTEADDGVSPDRPEEARTPVLQQHMPAPGGAVPDSAPGRADSAPSMPEDSARVPTGYVPFADQFDDFPAGSLIPDPAPPAEQAPPAERQVPPAAYPPPEPRPPANGAPDRAAPRRADESSSPGHRTQPLQRPPTTAPVDSAAPPSADDTALLAAFLRGLDLPSLQPRPDQAPAFMEEIGRQVRESVQGLIDILRLRAEFKHEFYVPATSIAPVANNLYKYSVNAEDALTRMLSDSTGKAYLGAGESTRQAFQDVAAHQLALVAGMEAAVAALLERFAPTALEQRIGKASMVEGVLPQVRRARLWEAFEQEYRQIADQAAADFQEILGQQFARAYTEQIKRLEQAGFGGKGEDNEQS